MPSSVLTHNNWLIKWTWHYPPRVTVHNLRNKEVKFYGTVPDRNILTIFKEEPNRVHYDIEEDGEHMELTLQLDDYEPRRYALRVLRTPPLATF